MIIDIKTRKDESKKEFISRFMSETEKEYPDRKQRFAVAMSYWNRRNVNDSKPHKELNPRFWKNEELKEEVKEKLIEIVDKFKDWLESDNIKTDFSDVIIVGSNASYNYTFKSDLDIHIIINCSDEELKLYNAYRNLFNKSYDIKFGSSKVEISVQNQSSISSNGIYSIYTGWLKKPNFDFKEYDLKEEIKSYEKKFKELEKSVDKIEEFINEIYRLREGNFDENSIDNQLFREIRKSGILLKAKKLKNKLENEELSIKNLGDNSMKHNVWKELIKDNAPEERPDIYGDWEWDEYRQDWYDNKTNAYYEEIVELAKITAEEVERMVGDDELDKQLLEYYSDLSKFSDEDLLNDFEFYGAGKEEITNEIDKKIASDIAKEVERRGLSSYTLERYETYRRIKRLEHKLDVAENSDFDRLFENVENLNEEEKTEKLGGYIKWLDEEIAKNNKELDELDEKIAKAKENSTFVFKGDLDELFEDSIKDDWHLINSYYSIDWYKGKDDGFVTNLSKSEGKQKALELIKSGIDSIYISRDSIYDHDGHQEIDEEEIVDAWIDNGKWKTSVDKWNLFSTNDFDEVVEELKDASNEEIKEYKIYSNDDLIGSADTKEEAMEMASELKAQYKNITIKK